MIQHRTNQTQPHYGQANQPQVVSALESLAERITEALFMRRGRLYLLCDQATEESIPSDLYQGFYLSANYDSMRSLQLALQRVCSSEGSLATVAGALVHNMTLYAVGTEHTCAWVWRSGHLIQVLPNPKGPALGLPEQASSPVLNPQPCHESQRRLYPGDIVILSSSIAGRKISNRLLRQVEAFSTNPESMAKTIAQFTRSSAEPHPPITVIRLPGTATTPQLPPQSEIEYAYAGTVDVTPQSKVSPILLAVVIALVAIVLAVIVTKPKLPPNLLRDFFIGTPRASQTTRAGTPVAGSPTPNLTPTLYATVTPTD
jgi:hypothetical protein